MQLATFESLKIENSQSRRPFCCDLAEQAHSLLGAR